MLSFFATEMEVGRKTCQTVQEHDQNTLVVVCTESTRTEFIDWMQALE